jgi:hypothetical protein
MTDLLSRLQSATGPSRELDAEIFKRSGKINEQHCRHWCRMDGRTDLTREDYIAAWAPTFTESIDATLTLMPKDLAWVIAAYKNHAPLIPPYSAGLFTLTGELKSEGESDAIPAIALLIAIERAKENTKP